MATSKVQNAKDKITKLYADSEGYFKGSNPKDAITSLKAKSLGDVIPKSKIGEKKLKAKTFVK